MSVLFRILATVLLCVPAAAQQAGVVELFRQARGAEQRRQFARAADLYDRILAFDSSIAEVWANKGLVLYELGRHRDAIGAFTRSAALNPQLFTPHLFLGISHLKLGETQQAVAPLRAALALEPHHPQAVYELANAYMRLEQFEAASELFQALAERHPEMEQARYQLGLCYLGWSKALARQLSESASLYGRLVLAEMHAVAGRLAEAQSILKLEIAGFQEQGPAFFDRLAQELEPPSSAAEPGISLYLAGQYPSALESLRSSSHARARYWLSRVCRALAREAFLDALSRNPASYRAHLLLADLSNSAGDAATALSEYERALALGAADPEVHLLLIQFLASKEKEADARDKTRAAVQKFPAHAALNYELGRLLLKDRNPAEAVVYFGRAVEKDAGLASARAGLADSYAALGQTVRAIREMKPALAVDTDGSLHYRYGRWCQKVGLERQAVEAFTRSSVLKEVRRKREQDYLLSDGPAPNPR